MTSESVHWYYQLGKLISSSKTQFAHTLGFLFTHQGKFQKANQGHIHSIIFLHYRKKLISPKYQFTRKLNNKMRFMCKYK